MSDKPPEPPHVATKTVEAFLATLERLTVAVELVSKAMGRLAEAAESQLELDVKHADPDHISAADIRTAGRDLLLVYTDELGVAAWGEEHGFEMSKTSNDTLRRWCLKMLAGEELDRQ